MKISMITPEESFRPFCVVVETKDELHTLLAALSVPTNQIKAALTMQDIDLQDEEMQSCLTEFLSFNHFY